MAVAPARPVLRILIRWAGGACKRVTNEDPEGNTDDQKKTQMLRRVRPAQRKKEKENTRPVTYPTRHDIGAHSPHPSTVRRPACSDISRPSRPLFSPSPLIAHSPKAANSSLRRCTLPHTPEPGVGRPLGSWDHSARRRSSRKQWPVPEPHPFAAAAASCPPTSWLARSLAAHRVLSHQSRWVGLGLAFWSWCVCAPMCPSSVCVRVLAKY